MEIKDYILVAKLRLMALLKGQSLSHLTNEEVFEKILIARLRAHFAFFGHYFDDMSDEEFKSMVTTGAERLVNAGITAEEAAKRLRMSFEKLID